MILISELNMESWKKVCIIVSVYVILREFRPIDPFIIKYLTFLPKKYTIKTVSSPIVNQGYTYTTLY